LTLTLKSAASCLELAKAGKYFLGHVLAAFRAWRLQWSNRLPCNALIWKVLYGQPKPFMIYRKKEFGALMPPCRRSAQTCKFSLAFRGTNSKRSEFNGLGGMRSLRIPGALFGPRSATHCSSGCIAGKQLSEYSLFPAIRILDLGTLFDANSSAGPMVWFDVLHV